RLHKEASPSPEAGGAPRAPRRGAALRAPPGVAARLDRSSGGEVELPRPKSPPRAGPARRGGGDALPAACPEVGPRGGSGDLRSGPGVSPGLLCARGVLASSGARRRRGDRRDQAPSAAPSVGEPDPFGVPRPCGGGLLEVRARLGDVLPRPRRPRGR